MSEARGRLGEKLIAAGLLSPDKLSTGLALQRREGGYLGDLLVSQGFVDETALLRLLAADHGGRYIGSRMLSQTRIEPEVLDLFPVREAERLSVLPLSFAPDTRSLSVAVCDLDPAVVAQVKAAVPTLKVVPILALRAAIRAGIQRFYYLDPYAFASVGWNGSAEVAPRPAGEVVARGIEPSPAQARPTPTGTASSLEQMLELHQMVEAQEKEIRLLRVALELQYHVARERSLSALVHRVLAFAFDNLPADDGALLLRDESSGAMTPCAVRIKEGHESQVVISETLLKEVVSTRKGVLTADAAYDPRFAASQTVITSRMRSAMAVPLMIQGEVRGAICLASRGRTGVFTESDLKVLSAIASQTSVSIENVLLSRRLAADAATRAHLSRFLSPALVELASSGTVNLEEAGELQEATILFADIRSFTSMAERLGPREVVSLLNEHFEAMVDVVFSHGGVLDKFLGDALMAIWGAPMRRPDDATRALRAALEMVGRVQEMNRQRSAESREQFAMGIGINTGMVVFGAMGASRRLELTAIGDPVNIASRLCGLAAPGQIVTTDATLRGTGGLFRAVALPPAQLKGKTGMIQPYAVTSER